MSTNKMETAKAEEKTEKKVVVPRTAKELQRIKLEKLMKKPDKPAFIPEKTDPKLPRVFNPQEFVRNVWGSSAGAGSGDFHVYRGVRRREYARQKFNNEVAKIDEKDAAFKEKLEQHKKENEERTAKKRAKRLKKKQKQKAAKKRKPNTKQPDEDEDDESDEDEEENPEDADGAEGTDLKPPEVTAEVAADQGAEQQETVAS